MDFENCVEPLLYPLPATNVEFLAHTLCDGPSRPSLIIQLKFGLNSKHHDGVVIFAHLAHACFRLMRLVLLLPC